MIEAQNALMQIKINSFPNWKESSQSKFLSQLNKQAYEWKSEKKKNRALSNKELAELLRARL